MYSGASYCKYEDLDIWDCGYPCLKLKGITQGNIVRSVQKDDDLFGFVAYNSED